MSDAPGNVVAKSAAKRALEMVSEDKIGGWVKTINLVLGAVVTGIAATWAITSRNAEHFQELLNQQRVRFNEQLKDQSDAISRQLRQHASQPHSDAVHVREFDRVVEQMKELTDEVRLLRNKIQ